DPVASGGLALEEPAATARRGTAGALKQSGDFTGESLPEGGAESRGPVAHSEARSLLPNGGQMERSAGESGGDFPFQHLFATAIPGGDPVPQIPYGFQFPNLPSPDIERLGRQSA